MSCLKSESINISGADLFFFFPLPVFCAFPGLLVAVDAAAIVIFHPDVVGDTVLLFFGGSLKAALDAEGVNLVASVGASSGCHPWLLTDGRPCKREGDAAVSSTTPRLMSN